MAGAGWRRQISEAQRWRDMSPRGPVLEPCGLVAVGSLRAWHTTVSALREDLVVDGGRLTYNLDQAEGSWSVRWP